MHFFKKIHFWPYYVKIFLQIEGHVIILFHFFLFFYDQTAATHLSNRSPKVAVHYIKYDRILSVSQINISSDSKHPGLDGLANSFTGACPFLQPWQ